MYEQIKALRQAVIDDMKNELEPGVPFTSDLLQVAESRVQTALGVAIQTITDEANESAQEGVNAATQT